MLSDQLKKPLNEIGYQKSVEILEELRILCGYDDLDILLLIAECHLHLMSDKKDSSLEDVEQFVSKSPSQSAENVRKMAHKMKQQGHYVRAMILYKISHDMRRKEKKISPDDDVKMTRRLIIDTRCAIDPLAKGEVRSRVIAINYGTKFLEQMLLQLRQVKGASPGAKALNELSSLVNIISINNSIGKHGKSIKFGEEGVTMMKQQFGERASKYRHYGWLLNNLGNAFDSAGQYSKAENCYLKAIEVKERAADFKNDLRRMESIKATHQNLEVTRENKAKK